MPEPGRRSVGAVFFAAMAFSVGLGLVGCQEPDRHPTAAAAADSADQLVLGLTHQMTVDGLLRAKLKADTARFYQNSAERGAGSPHGHFFFASRARDVDPDG